MEGCRKTKSCKRGEDEQCLHAANFRNAKIRNLRIFASCKNFHNLRNSQKNFAPPILEHLQQHKTKNYEKISLKNKEIFKILKIKGY